MNRQISTSEMTGSFTYYNAGAFAGPSGDVFMFTCWNAEHSGCGCHSVYAPDLAANIAALEKMGRVNRTARGERFDYSSRQWVRA